MRDAPITLQITEDSHGQTRWQIEIEPAFAGTLRHALALLMAGGSVMLPCDGATIQITVPVQATSAHPMSGENPISEQ